MRTPVFGHISTGGRPEKRQRNDSDTPSDEDRPPVIVINDSQGEDESSEEEQSRLEVQPAPPTAPQPAPSTGGFGVARRPNVWRTVKPFPDMRRSDANINAPQNEVILDAVTAMMERFENFLVQADEDINEDHIRQHIATQINLINFNLDATE